MPSNRVELAKYICEIGHDLIPLAKQYKLDSTAHCLELAIACAAEVVEKHVDVPGPRLVLVKDEGLQSHM